MVDWDLYKLFPEAAKKKKEQSILNIQYICLVEFGWSYEEFCNTPCWLIIDLLQKHKEIVKKKNGK